MEVKVATSEGKSDGLLDGERKTITALFADIKGSMELMEDLDPEEARAIIDPALKLMIEAVHRYGGYIVQSTGDGIFALFGAPIAHEDHPQRALFTALRLQEQLGRYSSQLRSQGRMPLQARVGLNTGDVVVRSIETGEGHGKNVDAAGGGGDEPGRDIEERRLPTAGRADDRDELTVGHRERGALTAV